MQSGASLKKSAKKKHAANSTRSTANQTGRQDVFDYYPGKETKVYCQTTTKRRNFGKVICSADA
jgi:hypothetical protein